jgi:hypothetical protein
MPVPDSVDLKNGAIDRVNVNSPPSKVSADPVANALVLDAYKTPLFVNDVRFVPPFATDNGVVNDKFPLTQTLPVTICAPVNIFDPVVASLAIFVVDKTSI